MRGVNAAVIRVKNRPSQASTLVFGHEQCVLDQAGAHVIRDGKADQPAGIAINDRRQVHIRPIRNRQVRNIPNVELVRLVSGELPAHQIREHRLLMIRHGGDDLAFLGVTKQFELTHDPRNSLVVHRFMTGAVAKLGQ